MAGLTFGDMCVRSIIAWIPAAHVSRYINTSHNIRLVNISSVFSSTPIFIDMQSHLMYSHISNRKVTGSRPSSPSGCDDDASMSGKWLWKFLFIPPAVPSFVWLVAFYRLFPPSS